MASRATSHGGDPAAEAAAAVDTAPSEAAAAAASTTTTTTDDPVLPSVTVPVPVRDDGKLPSMRETGSVTVVHLAAPAPPTATDASEDGTLPSSARDPLAVADDLVLDLLVLSGQRRRVRCKREERISDLKHRVWKDWPQDWNDSVARPDNPDRLTLLFRGRILADDKTLDGAGVKPFQDSHDPIVVHLHVKSLEPLPPDSDENRSGSSCSCCIIA